MEGTKSIKTTHDVPSNMLYAVIRLQRPTHGMQPSSGPDFLEPVPERGPIHMCRYTEVDGRWAILTESVVIQNVGSKVGVSV